MESKYYKATDVMAMLECSETYAYKVIRQLNEVLDGAIATIMALDRAIRCGNNNCASVYDNRGLLFI